MKDAPLLEASLPPPREGRCDLLVVAGEHSGDEHAARVIEAAREKQSNLAVCALGGRELEQAGAQILHDLTSSSVVGIFEVLKHYGYFKNLFEKTIAWIAEHRPHAVCFVDYPGFNLRLAQRLVEEGLARKGGGDMRLLYYISPQVWAWKKKRRFKMADVLDALAVIFPFEMGVFADTRLQTTYIGHPFAQENYQLPLRYDANAPALLLPGSRTQPVRRIFPTMLKGWELFLKKQPNARATVIYPSEGVLAVIDEALAQTPKNIRESIELVTDAAEPVPASAVLTSSGTMSLNVALAGIPGAIVYRAHPLTYAIGRMLVDIPYLGIANILLDQPAWQEFIQGDARPAVLAYELNDAMHNPERRALSQNCAEHLHAMLAAEAQESPEDWLLSRMR